MEMSEEKKCWYCGTPLTPPPRWKGGQISKNPKNMRTLDHRLPKSKGGTDDEENLVDACWACNCSKGNRDVEGFRRIVDRRNVAGSACQLIEKAILLHFHTSERHRDLLLAIIDDARVEHPIPVFYGESL